VRLSWRLGRNALSHRAPSQEAPEALATLWVKHLNVSQYSAVKRVDLHGTLVDDFKAIWAAEVQLGVHPSLILLRLVSCAGDEPTQAEEEASLILQSRLTLLAAGVTDGCSLLASVTVSAVSLLSPTGEYGEQLRCVTADSLCPRSQLPSAR